MGPRKALDGRWRCQELRRQTRAPQHQSATWLYRSPLPAGQPRALAPLWCLPTPALGCTWFGVHGTFGRILWGKLGQS